MARVVLYVKTGCPWCAEVERILDRYGLSYDRVDILRNAQGSRRLAKMIGKLKTPALEWDEEVLAGFSEEELRSFLELRGFS
jgi:glutaredoxin 3